MPDPNIKLSVVKLDNTSFEVKIAASASVSDLKTAVENVFRDRAEEDCGLISWAHVWGHFCLCFQDFKLADDRAFLKDFGIKDGDQLRFTRKLSVRLWPAKQTQKGQEENTVQNALKPQGPEETEEVDKKEENHHRRSKSLDEAACENQDQSNADNATTARTKSKLTRRLRSMLSYSKLGTPHASEKTGEYF